MPIGSTRSQYIVPPATASGDERLGWLTEVAEQGEAFNKAQRGWADIDKAVDIISGSVDLKIPKGMSGVSANVLKQDIRGNVATLANMRPMSAFKTDNDEMQKQAMVLNQMYLAWYLGSFADQAVREALQYAMGCCLGWLCPMWENNARRPGVGDIVLKSKGPRDVLLYGLPQDKNTQNTYVVTICDEVPINIAMRDYPLHLDMLVVDKGTPTWMRKGIRRVQRFLSPLLNAFGPGQGKEKQDSPFPTVSIFKSYIMDEQINTSEREITMGEGTNWEYKVPVYKSEIETGTFDKEKNPLYRKATAEDAKIYPLRRLVKWTKAGILYDGTSTYWHGQAPAVPVITDGWPWDFFGYSQVRDGASLQTSANRVMRALDDTVNVKLDSPLSFDSSAMGQGLIDRLNPRKPGQRIKINSTQNEQPVKTIIPAEYYNVDAQAWEWPAKMHELIHSLLGTRDISAIAKAKQVPSGDSMEKLMELAGPIVTDMSRGLERSMIAVGEQWKGLALQYYDVARRVQILGKDGVTEEDFDYDPGNMIPSHLPDEMARIKRGEFMNTDSEGKKVAMKSRADIVQRARSHINSFYFHVTPNSMHQITQLTQKMLFMQLFAKGFPIDPWTLAEKMDIANFGSPHQVAKILQMPDSNVPTDVLGKWIMWMELKSKLMPQPAGAGRKGSGQTPPAHQSKDGGQRTTVRESPR